VNMTWKTNQ